MVTTVEIKAEAEWLTANGVSTTLITVKLLDQHLEPVSDETVNLVADRGTIPSTAKNEDGGTYTATYKSGLKPGDATITAVTTTTGKAGNLILTLKEQQVSAQKSTVSLDKNWATIGVDTATVKIQIVSEQGLPVTGKTIVAKVDPDQEVTVGSAKPTDEEGRTKVDLTSTTTGQRTVTVSVGQVVLESKPTITPLPQIK